MGGVRWTEDELARYLQRHPDAADVQTARFINAVNSGMSLAQAVDNFSKAMEPHARILAIEDGDEPGPDFKSKTEERAWQEWVPTTNCVGAYYEPFRVYLNSGSYRPDIVLRMPDRELWLIEVKGSWNAYQSGRSSKKSLLEAAKMYWWLGRWFSLLPEKKGGGWNLEEIK